MIWAARTGKIWRSISSSDFTLHGEPGVEVEGPSLSTIFVEEGIKIEVLENISRSVEWICKFHGENLKNWVGQLQSFKTCIRTGNESRSTHQISRIAHCKRRALILIGMLGGDGGVRLRSRNGRRWATRWSI